jgi:hypothetical protein
MQVHDITSCTSAFEGLNKRASIECQGATAPHLTKDEVVWPEDLAVWATADRVHCAWLLQTIKLSFSAAGSHSIAHDYADNMRQGVKPLPNVTPK